MASWSDTDVLGGRSGNGDARSTIGRVSDLARYAWFRDRGRDLAVAAAAISLAAGLGWALGLEMLVRVHGEWPAMVPETVGNALLGAAGALSLYWRSRRAVTLGCGVLILALTAFTMWRLAGLHGEDEMSIATAAGCLLLAASLLVRWRLRDGAGWLAVTIETSGLCVCMVPMLGYIYNAESLFLNPIYTKMSLQTAVSFGALFLGLMMIDPRSGWMGILSGPEHGSAMARRILPVVVAGPLLLTSLALYVTSLEMLTPDLRASFLTMAMIVATGAATIYFAHLTNCAERRSALADSLLRESERARQASEIAMARAQKVEALGQLVGGVAHDFNNTLTVIIGNLELLEQDPDVSRRPGYVKEAVRASNQAASFTRQLLAYGRKSRLDPAPRRFDDLIPAPLKMFERIRPANLSIFVDLRANGAVVEVDAANFEQALLNILINARDAQPDGGAIKVETALLKLDGEVVDGFGGAEPLADGVYAVAIVSDRGPGLSPEAIQRATEPFFTTKPPGEGTGLGLSVASGFCVQSGGGLTVATDPGGGARISMAFPATSADVEEAPGPSIERAPHAPRNVLVVDDEPGVLHVVARHMALDGHEVRLAASADEALDVIASAPPPDLVITDLAMPGEMQGHELADLLRRRYPGIKVVLMSGYESLRQRRRMSIARDLPFLQKPIDRETLRRVVAEALEAE